MKERYSFVDDVIKRKEAKAWEYRELIPQMFDRLQTLSKTGHFWKMQCQEFALGWKMEV
jgi:hypothetical protein